MEWIAKFLILLPLRIRFLLLGIDFKSWGRGISRKHSLDFGFGAFVDLLEQVCQKRQVYFGKVSSYFTSQTCPNCGTHTVDYSPPSALLKGGDSQVVLFPLAGTVKLPLDAQYVDI
ncbi:zinc ribbon domain-containing protein [Oscillatoria salina]|uniref:zinc ribbon domain-containing protein n=1 Tax=Oscillatoria salina TaxID=331517 RepID=UPI001CCF6653|nr:zinc ribbon domain-containing protein [Oscillatoria salina]